MKINKLLALSMMSAALLFSVNAQAKDIKIGSNNTAYSDSDVQKLAATAAGMGVKEPMTLSQAGGSVTVSGSNDTKCVFKVAAGSSPQIQGVSCK